jgi:hypothetical protein
MYNLCIIQYILGNGMFPDDKDPSYQTYYPVNTIGHHLLFSPESRRIIEYIVTKNASLYLEDIKKFNQLYGASATKMIASLVHWHPEKRGGGKGQILKNHYFKRFIKKR